MENIPSDIKALALEKELRNATRLINAGLGQLQALNGGNDFYHLPVLTLASGFERLMKVILDFSGETFPIGRKGHNLNLLLEPIRKKCFNDGYTRNVPAASKDLEYLQSEDLQEFILLLSNFGMSARYYYLDIIRNESPEFDSPETSWHKIQMSIFLRCDDLMKKMSSNPTEFSSEITDAINADMVRRLEKFARALARLFTIGPIKSEARRYVGHIETFLYIRDNELGERIYDPCGARTAR